MIVFQYTQKELNKVFGYRSAKPEMHGVKSDNQFLEIDVEDFGIFGRKKDKIVISLKPKVVGTFRIIAVFFRVFNIPRFFNFDNEINTVRYFLSYLHEIEPTPENISRIVVNTNDHKFINKNKETSAVNC